MLLISIAWRQPDRKLSRKNGKCVMILNTMVTNNTWDANEQNHLEK